MVAAVDGSGETNQSNGNGLPRSDFDLGHEPLPSSPSDEDRHGGAEVAEESRPGGLDRVKDRYGDGSAGLGGCGTGMKEVVVRPPPHLPQPEVPPGVGGIRAFVEPTVVPTVITKSATTNGRIEDERRGAGGMDRSLSAGAGRTNGGGIGKYLRDRGAALAKRWSMGDEEEKDNNDDKEMKLLQEVVQPPPPLVTEFHLSGVRVIVRVKEDDGDYVTSPEVIENPATASAGAPPAASTVADAPRITFFSRSNCRDCGAVRSFFRSRRLPYVEINVDVFPSRLKELVRRTGSHSVPQIFFNGHLVGGLVALNSLRNSGELDRRLGEMMAMPAPPGGGPLAVPVVGVDDDDDEEEGWEEDRVAGLVRAVRGRVVVSDRFARMKLVRSCFTGSELVEAVIDELDCGRKKAVEMCKELERKHFLHPVFRDAHQQGEEAGTFNDAAAANRLYRFLDHDPTVYRCYNMGLGLSYREPRSVSWLARRITAVMHAILEAYASDDRTRVDYDAVAASEEFRRYIKLAQELQRVDVFDLPSADDRLAFFLNLYNAMVIHAVVCIGRRPQGAATAAAGATGGVVAPAYYGDFQYMVGGYPYTLSDVKNGVLRSNRRQPYSIARPFAAADKRLELAPAKVSPLIHFGLCDSTRSSPPVRFFSPQGVEADLRKAARDFFQKGAMGVDLDKRTVYLTRIIKWYSADFGQEKDILNWVLNFLDPTRAGLLTHLLSDGGPVTIVYQDYDWSLNI